MKEPKFLFNLLLYLSIPFLLFYLYKVDYLSFNVEEWNYSALAISIALVFSGFLLSAYSWKIALKSHNIKVSVKQATVSHGLSVFAKYIPGKLWVILGRASYLSNGKRRLSLLSYISLKEQFIFLLTGFVISLVPVHFILHNIGYDLAILVTILLLFALLFVKPIHDLFCTIINRIFKKDINIPFLELEKSVSIIVITIIYWLLWSLGFLALIYSVTGELQFLYSFAFPVSACYGVLAIIMPGGIGVRESIMSFILVSAGMLPTDAISISVLARLWFILGEVLIFITALLLRRNTI